MTIESASDALGHPLQLLNRSHGCGILEVELTLTPDRNQVDVEMRDLHPHDHQTDLDGIPLLVDGSPDSRCHGEEVVAEVRRAIQPVVDLLARDDEGVTGVQRVDGQKCHASIITMNEGCW